MWDRRNQPTTRQILQCFSLIVAQSKTKMQYFRNYGDIRSVLRNQLRSTLSKSQAVRSSQLWKKEKFTTTSRLRRKISNSVFKNCLGHCRYYFMPMKCFLTFEQLSTQRGQCDWLNFLWLFDSSRTNIFATVKLRKTKTNDRSAPALSWDKLFI